MLLKRLTKIKCKKHLHTTKVSIKVLIIHKILTGTSSMMIQPRITGFQEKLVLEAAPHLSKVISKIKPGLNVNSNNTRIFLKIQLRLEYDSLLSLFQVELFTQENGEME